MKRKMIMMGLLVSMMSLAACGGNGGGEAGDSSAAKGSSKKKASSGFVISSVEKKDLPKYEVKIVDANGTAISTEQMEHGTHLTKPADPAAQSGKTFYGWKNVKNGNQIWDFENDDINVVMSDVELQPFFVDSALKNQPFEAELCPQITEANGGTGMDGMTYSGGQKGTGLIGRDYDDEFEASGAYYRDEDGKAHYATTPAEKAFGGFVHFFYTYGNEIIWELESDAAASNVTLLMRLSGEYGIENKDTEEVTDTFSSTDFPVSVNGVAQQYGNITIHNIEPKTFITFQDFVVATNVNLVAGRNTISMKVDNHQTLNGTIECSAPVIDCIKVLSTSNLTWPNAKLSQMDKVE